MLQLPETPVTVTPMTTHNTVTYTVRLYVATRWATGTVRGSRTAVYHVDEDATVAGGLRAIEAAYAMAGEDNVLDDLHSPELEPNPALEGWPLGFPEPEAKPEPMLTCHGCGDVVAWREAAAHEDDAHGGTLQTWTPNGA